MSGEFTFRLFACAKKQKNPDCSALPFRHPTRGPSSKDRPEQICAGIVAALSLDRGAVRFADRGVSPTEEQTSPRVAPAPYPRFQPSSCSTHAFHSVQVSPSPVPRVSRRVSPLAASLPSRLLPPRQRRAKPVETPPHLPKLRILLARGASFPVATSPFPTTPAAEHAAEPSFDHLRVGVVGSLSRSGVDGPSSDSRPSGRPSGPCAKRTPSSTRTAFARRRASTSARRLAVSVSNRARVSSRSRVSASSFRRRRLQSGRHRARPFAIPGGAPPRRPRKSRRPSNASGPSSPSLSSRRFRRTLRAGVRALSRRP